MPRKGAFMVGFLKRPFGVKKEDAEAGVSQTVSVSQLVAPDECLSSYEF